MSSAQLVGIVPACEVFAARTFVEKVNEVLQLLLRKYIFSGKRFRKVSALTIILHECAVTCFKLCNKCQDCKNLGYVHCILYPCLFRFPGHCIITVNFVVTLVNFVFIWTLCHLSRHYSAIMIFQAMEVSSGSANVATKDSVVSQNNTVKLSLPTSAFWMAWFVKICTGDRGIRHHVVRWSGCALQGAPWDGGGTKPKIVGGKDPCRGVVFCPPNRT